jgi:hypothetical protein
MQIVSILACEVSFSTVYFFKMIYVTLIVSSNGSGDISSRPLLPGLF